MKLIELQTEKKDLNMGQVINVDFSTKSYRDDGLSAYLDYLREGGIDEDDIQDILDAIFDKNCYFKADDIIQQFAAGWFDQVK